MRFSASARRKVQDPLYARPNEVCSFMKWESKIPRGKTAQKEYLQEEKLEPSFRAANEKVRAIAKAHRLRTEVIEDGRVVIPSRGESPSRGYWTPLSSGNWLFYHPDRRDPAKDVATLRELEPRLIQHLWSPQQIFVEGPEAAALRVMLLDAPVFTSARRMRPRRALTPDQLAAMAAGKARKASQALQNPESSPLATTPPYSPTQGTSHPPDAVSEGIPGLEGPSPTSTDANRSNP